MRRKVEHERRALRRQAQRIAFAVIGFIALQAMFARGWVRALLVAARPAGPGDPRSDLPRCLRCVCARCPTPKRSPDSSHRPDEVTDIASYKPGLVRIGGDSVIAFMIAAGVLAIAVLHGYRLAVPPRADLAGAVRHWDSSRARATRLQRIGAPRATTRRK